MKAGRIIRMAHNITHIIPERYLLLALVLLWEAAGYFLINTFTHSREAFTLSLQLDIVLPFLPSFAIFYIMEYILGVLPFLLIESKRLLRSVALLYLAVITFSYIVFFLFPVQMLRPEIIPQTISGELVSLIYLMDLPYNAFPSLHIILMLLSGLILFSVRNPAAPFMLFMFVPVALSTVLIKQHYILDVLGGVVVAVAAFLLFLRFMPVRRVFLQSQISS